MANSEFEHADPDRKVIGIQINHTYATLLTMLSAGMMGVINDYPGVLFVDKDGNPHKTLQDSTGAASIPVNSVIFADTSGKATYNTDFKFDASNARIEFPLPFTLAFGDQDTNGSMRIRITTDGIYFGKRVSGSWSEVNLIA
jgi:hypothetical protein